MHQEVGLIATVAVSFVFAAILGYVADRLRLPPLVGYLMAGILMGPSPMLEPLASCLVAL
ncbi:cation:proton antiporter, partial [Rhizobium leguminosarum]